MHQPRRICKILCGPEPAKQPHLILLQVKLDYIPNIFPQTACPGKLTFRALGSIEAQNKQSRLFLPFFFSFSNIPAEPFILEENFCEFKFSSH